MTDHGRRQGKTFSAIFKVWGTNFCEFESGVGNYSVAIFEKADGTVDFESVNYIRFTDKLAAGSAGAAVRCEDVHPS